MTEEKLNKLEACVGNTLSGLTRDIRQDRQELSIEVNPSQLLQTMRILKENEELSFGQLIDIATVDHLHYGISDWKTNDASGKGFSRAKISEKSNQENERRFQVVYHLLSLRHNWRIRVKTFVVEDMKLDTGLIY